MKKLSEKQIKTLIRLVVCAENESITESGSAVYGELHSVLVDMLAVLPTQRALDGEAVCVCKVDPAVNRIDGICLLCGLPRPIGKFMKPMISKKGSQQVVVLGGNGCVTISATDRKKHVSNSVTVFDELLPGLIARLSAIAAQRRRTQDAPDRC